MIDQIILKTITPDNLQLPQAIKFAIGHPNPNKITEEDVVRVFGLPRGPLPIVEVDKRKQKKNQQDPEHERLLQELLQDMDCKKGEASDFF